MAHSKAEARRSGSAVAVTVHYTSYSKLSIHDSVLYCIVLYLFHINYSILISLYGSKSSILMLACQVGRLTVHADMSSGHAVSGP